MLHLIPKPTKIEIDGSATMEICALLSGDHPLPDAVWQDFAGSVPSVSKNAATGTEIKFRTDEAMDGEEYSISTNGGISITAGGGAGYVYALQTLKQIMHQCGTTLPVLHIEDKPVHGVRGFMLDVGRYFFPVEDVKTIIRRMAMHKLNLLHLHLTEDQGWRIESERYPLLTQKGSIRRRTNFDHKPHGGYYTKNDIREIVAYAHDFGIKVMPEFDIPGHSRAAMACYPWLGCFDRELPVADHWGVKHDVLCAGKESTYRFVQDIIDELCELFPDEYIHIGGDEVPKHRWHLCPHCRDMMEKQGLADEEELQCYFMNRVNDYCRSKGKQAFMWSWDLKDSGSLDPSLGFTKCGDMDTGDRPFIDTGTQAYYIDLPYGYISLTDSAEHKPYSGNCLGVEATLWTEYVPDMEKADKMTYPRLAPICETAWSGETSRQSIGERLDFYYSFLRSNGIGYSDISTADPSPLRGKLQGLWFERRQLTWEGLTNIIDDKRVERLAAKIK